MFLQKIKKLKYPLLISSMTLFSFSGKSHSQVNFSAPGVNPLDILKTFLEPKSLGTETVVAGTMDGFEITLPRISSISKKPPEMLNLLLSQGLSQAKQFKLFGRFFPEDSLLLDLILQNLNVFIALSMGLYESGEQALELSLAKSLGVDLSIYDLKHLSSNDRLQIKLKSSKKLITPSPTLLRDAQRFFGTAMIKELFIPWPLAGKPAERQNLIRFGKDMANALTFGLSFRKSAQKCLPKGDISLKIYATEKKSKKQTVSFLYMNSILTDYVPCLNLSPGQAVAFPTEQGLRICKILSFSPVGKDFHTPDSLKLEDSYVLMRESAIYDQRLFNRLKTGTLEWKNGMLALFEKSGKALLSPMQLVENLTVAAKKGKLNNLKDPLELVKSIDQQYVQLIDSMMDMINGFYLLADPQNLKTDPEGTYLAILFRAISSEINAALTKDLTIPHIKKFYLEDRILALKGLTALDCPLKTHLILADLLAETDQKEAVEHLKIYLNPKKSGLLESVIEPKISETYRLERIRRVEKIIKEIKTKKLAEDHVIEALEMNLST